MAKQRISSNVSSELAIQIKDTAKKAGLSVSALIEKAVEGLLGRSCMLVENSQLRQKMQLGAKHATEFKAEHKRLSRQITGIKSERDVIKRKHQSELCRLANTIGVEYQIEIKKPLDDAYLTKLCEAIHAKIEVLTESHDIYKAASEESAEQLAACEAKIKALLDRGWWARLCNRIPQGIIKPTGE